MDVKEVGQEIQRELIGEDFVENKAKKRNAFNSVIHEYSEEVCFGRVRARERIDRKIRSILNVAMLIPLNRPNQFRTYLEGAPNEGFVVEKLAHTKFIPEGYSIPWIFQFETHANRALAVKSI